MILRLLLRAACLDWAVCHQRSLLRGDTLFPVKYHLREQREPTSHNLTRPGTKALRFEGVAGQMRRGSVFRHTGVVCRP